MPRLPDAKGRGIALALAISLSSAAFLPFPAGAQQAAMVLPTDPAPLVAVTDEGERRFTIEIADDDRERGAGLMFRQDMADDHGMLFVMGETRQVGFWMRNTPMPLDLLFIAEDGKVKAIMQGEPFSDAAISPGVPVRFVLELKAGTSARLGIEDGDVVQHPAIAAASD